MRPKITKTTKKLNKGLTKTTPYDILKSSKERKKTKMINPTKEWLINEAKAIAESTIDDILFYMQEYGGEKFTYSEIAEIFSNVYSKLIKQIAKEMEEKE